MQRYVKLAAGLVVAIIIGLAGNAFAGETAHALITQEDIAVNVLVFLLSTFLGLQLILHVSKLLHTPLMSLTNAISSVSVVAALIVLSYPGNSTFITALAAIGVALAASNFISGFMITERILKMFKKSDGGK